MQCHVACNNDDNSFGNSGNIIEIISATTRIVSVVNPHLSFIYVIAHLLIEVIKYYIIIAK